MKRKGKFDKYETLISSFDIMRWGEIWRKEEKKEDERGKKRKRKKEDRGEIEEARERKREG